MTLKWYLEETRLDDVCKDEYIILDKSGRKMELTPLTLKRKIVKVYIRNDKLHIIIE